jgi:hypothetical protein
MKNQGKKEERKRAIPTYKNEEIMEKTDYDSIMIILRLQEK